ncbi:hypothetical protein D3C76_1619780 [compost metagenome]
MRRFTGRPFSSKRPSITASPLRARSNTSSANAAASSSFMGVGLRWSDMGNLLAIGKAQVFVRERAGSTGDKSWP